MLRIVFDVPRLKSKRKELEQISAQPEFWENQEEAKKQMLILDDVKAQLELLDKWEFERLLCGEYDKEGAVVSINACLLYTSPSPRD